MRDKRPVATLFYLIPDIRFLEVRIKWSNGCISGAFHHRLDPDSSHGVAVTEVLQVRRKVGFPSEDLRRLSVRIIVDSDHICLVGYISLRILYFSNSSVSAS